MKKDLEALMEESQALTPEMLKLILKNHNSLEWLNFIRNFMIESAHDAIEKVTSTILGELKVLTDTCDQRILELNPPEKTH